VPKFRKKYAYYSSNLFHFLRTKRHNGGELPVPPHPGCAAPVPQLDVSGPPGIDERESSEIYLYFS